ncbi:hypothetical protein [Streptomyces sp. NPDC018059]
MGPDLRAVGVLRLGEAQQSDDDDLAEYVLNDDWEHFGHQA